MYKLTRPKIGSKLQKTTQKSPQIQEIHKTQKIQRIQQKSKNIKNNQISKRTFRTTKTQKNNPNPEFDGDYEIPNDYFSHEKSYTRQTEIPLASNTPPLSSQPALYVNEPMYAPPVSMRDDKGNIIEPTDARKAQLEQKKINFAANLVKRLKHHMDIHTTPTNANPTPAMVIHTPTGNHRLASLQRFLSAMKIGGLSALSETEFGEIVSLDHYLTLIDKDNYPIEYIDGKITAEITEELKDTYARRNRDENVLIVIEKFKQFILNDLVNLGIFTIRDLTPEERSYVKKFKKENAANDLRGLNPNTPLLPPLEGENDGKNGFFGSLFEKTASHIPIFNPKSLPKSKLDLLNASTTFKFDLSLPSIHLPQDHVHKDEIDKTINLTFLLHPKDLLLSETIGDYYPPHVPLCADPITPMNSINDETQIAEEIGFDLNNTKILEGYTDKKLIPVKFYETEILKMLYKKNLIPINFFDTKTLQINSLSAISESMAPYLTNMDHLRDFFTMLQLQESAAIKVLQEIRNKGQQIDVSIASELDGKENSLDMVEFERIMNDLKEKDIDLMQERPDLVIKFVNSIKTDHFNIGKNNLETASSSLSDTLIGHKIFPAPLSRVPLPLVKLFTEKNKKNETGYYDPPTLELDSAQEHYQISKSAAEQQDNDLFERFYENSQQMLTNPLELPLNYKRQDVKQISPYKFILRELHHLGKLSSSGLPGYHNAIIPAPESHDYNMLHESTIEYLPSRRFAKDVSRSEKNISPHFIPISGDKSRGFQLLPTQNNIKTTIFNHAKYEPDDELLNLHIIQPEEVLIKGKSITKNDNKSEKNKNDQSDPENTSTADSPHLPLSQITQAIRHVPYFNSAVLYDDMVDDDGIEPTIINRFISTKYNKQRKMLISPSIARDHLKTTMFGLDLMFNDVFFTSLSPPSLLRQIIAHHSVYDSDLLEIFAKDEEEAFENFIAPKIETIKSNPQKVARNLQNLQNSQNSQKTPQNIQKLLDTYPDQTAAFMTNHLTYRMSTETLYKQRFNQIPSWDPGLQSLWSYINLGSLLESPSALEMNDIQRMPKDKLNEFYKILPPSALLPLIDPKSGEIICERALDHALSKINDGNASLHEGFLEQFDIDNSELHKWGKLGLTNEQKRKFENFEFKNTKRWDPHFARDNGFLYKNPFVITHLASDDQENFNEIARHRQYLQDPIAKARFIAKINFDLVQFQGRQPVSVGDKKKLKKDHKNGENALTFEKLKDKYSIPIDSTLVIREATSLIENQSALIDAKRNIIETSPVEFTYIADSYHQYDKAIVQHAVEELLQQE
jgi:hypothetical protein